MSYWSGPDPVVSLTDLELGYTFFGDAHFVEQTGGIVTVQDDDQQHRRPAFTVQSRRKASTGEGSRWICPAWPQPISLATGGLDPISN